MNFKDDSYKGKESNISHLCGAKCFVEKVVMMLLFVFIMLRDKKKNIADNLDVLYVITM